MLITLLHLCMAFLALQTGALLADLQIYFSPGWLVAAAALFLLAMIFYPGKSRKKKSGKAIFYAWQKSCDLALIASSFFALTLLSNADSGGMFLSNSTRASSSSLPQPASGLLTEGHAASTTEIKRAEKKKLRTTLRAEWKNYKMLRKQGRKDEAGESILIVLTVLVALGLTILLTALSCSISCGGAEGLAIFVFVLGLAGIVLGSIAIIRQIRRKSRQGAPSRGPTMTGITGRGWHAGPGKNAKMKKHDIFIQGLSAGGA